MEALPRVKDGGVDVAKRKSDYPETEVEETSEPRDLAEELAQEEGEDGRVVAGAPPLHTSAAEMEEGLFEDLKDSIREAGAILRGEREAARRTQLDSPSESESDTTWCPSDPERTESGN